MIRIDRDKLDAAVDAVMDAAQNAKSCQGLRIQFPIDRLKAENLILGALSVIAPGGGPCTASDVTFVVGFGTESAKFWPPVI